jgi:hypothetical protein
VYLPLANAVIHIAHASITRSYNPGLVSAIVLFLPLCAWCLHVIQRSGAGTLAMHAIGFAGALLIHAVIAVKVLSNRRRLA